MGNYQSSKIENIDLNENKNNSKLDNEVNVTYKVQNNFQDYIYLILIRTLYGSENKVMFSYNYMDIYNYIELFKKNIYNENSFINVEESPIENQYIYKKYESIPLENLNEKYINSINETKLIYSLRFYKELKNIINSSQNHISSLYIYKVYKMDPIQTDNATEDDNTEDDNTEDDNTENDNTENDNTESDNTENDNTENDNIEDDNTEDDNTEDDNTEDDNTEDGNTEQQTTIEDDNTEDNNTEQQTTIEDDNTEDELVLEGQIEDVEGDLPPLEDLLKLLPPPPPVIRSTNSMRSRRTGSMSLPSSPRFIRQRGLTIIDTSSDCKELDEELVLDNNVNLYNSDRLEELPPLPQSDSEDN